MKNIQRLFIGLLIVFAWACSSDKNISSNIGETSIGRLHEERLSDIPFENEVVLKSFADDPQILDYDTARKLALVEFLATEFDVDMGWEGHRMKPIPVVVYGFDNRPKFYDFIVIDAEEQLVGTISVHARRAAATSIRSVFHGIRDYRTILSKTSFQASLFEDWRGNSYVGLLGKAGDTPDLVIDPETGETVTGITEIEGEEIIAALIENDSFIQMFEDSNGEGVLTSAGIEAMLHESFETEAKNAAEFWTIMYEILPEIENMEDEHELIDSSSRFIRRIVRAIILIFTGVDKNRYYIDKYTNYDFGFREGESSWCGPWVVSYLQWINDGRNGWSDSYDHALGFASNLFGTRPMTPWQFNNALRSVSSVVSPNITIDDILSGAVSARRLSLNLSVSAQLQMLCQVRAHDRIRKNKSPVAVLGPPRGKITEDGLHWYLAVGTRATNIWSLTFLVQDNSNSGRNIINDKKDFPDENNNRRKHNNKYITLPVWSMWFFVNE